MHNFGLGANQSYSMHLIEHTPKHTLSNLRKEYYFENQIIKGGTVYLKDSPGYSELDLVDLHT